MDISLFKQRFKGLTEEEKILLKILAIAFEAVDIQVLSKILRGLDIRDKKNNLIQSFQLQEYRVLLEAGDWIESAGKKEEMRITEKFRELVMRMAVVDPDYRRIAQMVSQYLPYYSEAARPRNFEVCIRELRLSLYNGNLTVIATVNQDIQRFYPQHWEGFGFYNQIFLPFDPSWFSTFRENVQMLALKELIRHNLDAMEPVEAYLEYAYSRHFTREQLEEDTFESLFVLPALLQGKFSEQLSILAALPFIENHTDALSCFLFFSNRNEEALVQFQSKIKKEKWKSTGTKALYSNFSGIVYILALLKSGEKERLKKSREFITADACKSPFGNIFQSLQVAILYQLHLPEREQALARVKPKSALDWVFYGASLFWSDLSISPEDLAILKTWYFKATKNKYHWVALELAQLIAKYAEEPSTAASYSDIVASLEKQLGTQSILHLIAKTESWERTLDALLQLPSAKSGKKTVSEKTTRLAWLIRFDTPPDIQPVEQSLGKNGWSKGRNVALKRLKEFQIDNMTDQDREAARAIKMENTAFYTNPEYYFDMDLLLPALGGHPLLFLMDNPNIPAEIIEKKLQLIVEQKNNDFSIYFSQDFREAGIQLFKETPTRFVLIRISELQAEVNRLLENGSMSFPALARDKIFDLISKLSPVMTVQSEVGGEVLHIPAVDGNPTIYIHLLPVGEGFKIEFFVKPFSSAPPYLKPGQGRRTIISEVSGTSLRAVRDLQLETDNALAVENACPTLQKIAGEHKEWLFEEVEDCLNVLTELEPLRKEGLVVLEYPRGEKLRIAGSLNFGQLSMGVRKERDWFEVDGKVQVNEDLVLDFKQLLELSQQSPHRFVQISEGQFIALTNQLKRKLDELSHLFSKTKSELRLHPLAIHTLEDFTGELKEFRTDAAWKDHLARFNEALSVCPEVPSTFKAELRPYQLQGYQWLAQLAHWGVGACLADDMGLGKTVQTLALLLERASIGSAMVVAPASVVRNWFHETIKFCPTLRPLIFSEGARRDMVAALQPFDLLLVSYGLLQQESELLADCHFATIVLDEAQAIKNRATKRSQAAMQLQADFKIITTGTPIENHLGELWNLFNFLNPGLLGSLERFNENYAIPIEKNQDKESRAQLRRLIQPFLLRRRKNDVLEELPPKTEITLSVELSEEERSFYEALRRQALLNIESGEGATSDRRFKILAELMRLRQAACHPRLVQPDSNIPSSKLNLLAETIEELREEGHKALIFSQFVKHLRIVEEWIQKMAIPYQYLDGATPLPQRDKAIRAFQEGQGDVFLISLKAGGFGLNLTAADYVIHLDPWWNPAVEDQASDRAHRIGQLRPVTIYRLVAENTIEDKIVQLHGEKRELADSLLEGSEVSGKLSSEELLELIRS